MNDIKCLYGDIILVHFDPSFGKEIKKLRPAVVVSNNVINTNSPFFVIVPCTTNTAFVNAIRILLEPNESNHLKKPSVIMCEQIRSIDKRRLVKKLGSVNRNTMKRIQNAIDVVLNRY